MSAESLSMQEAPLCSSRSISTGKKWKKIFPPLPAGEEEELLSPFVPKPSRPYDAVGLVWMTDSIYFMHHHDEGLHNSHFLKQEYSSALLLQQTSSTKDATLLDFHTLTLCINAPSTSSINLIPSSLRYLDNPSDAEGHATGCDNILPLATAFSEALYSKWIEIINKSRNTSRNSSRMHSNNNSPLARHAGGRKEMDFDISEVYSEEDEIATKYPYNIQIDESVQDPLNKSIGIMQTSSQSDDESQYADSKQGEVRVEGVADKRFVASTDVIGSIIVPTPLSLPARQSITDIIEKGHLKLRSMQR